MSRLEAKWHFVVGFSGWENQQVTRLLMVLSPASSSGLTCMVSATLAFILPRLSHFFVLLAN